MRRNLNYRFLLNTDPNHYEIHDLDNEQTGRDECQIDEIIHGGNYKYLSGNSITDVISWIDSHPEYDGCKHCLPTYHNK
jgi:hypothetical protein